MKKETKQTKQPKQPRIKLQESQGTIEEPIPVEDIKNFGISFEEINNINENQFNLTY